MNEWYASANKEYFNAGPYESEEVAKLEAPNDLGLKMGDEYFIGEPIYVDVRELINADDILDLMTEKAYDLVGDAIDGWPHVLKDEKLELNGQIICLLEDWLKKTNNEITFFKVINIKKVSS